MIISHKYEGKNEEELINKALQELNASKEETYYYVEKQEGGLFKSKKVIVNIILKEEIISYIKDYFANLSNLMQLKINCEIRIDERYIKILLISDNNSIIIGRNGKTLNAIQLLLKQALNNLNKYNLRLLLDASNYKEKRNRNLEWDLNQICKEVLKTKVEVKLDPMNSYERRIIHTIVSQYENLASISEGEEPNRYTIIKYKD